MTKLFVEQPRLHRVCSLPYQGKKRHFIKQTCVFQGQVCLPITFKHSEATIQQVVHRKRRDRNSQAQEVREEPRCANEWLQANVQRAQLAARTGIGLQDKHQGRSMWGRKFAWIKTIVPSPEGRGAQ